MAVSKDVSLDRLTPSLLGLLLAGCSLLGVRQPPPRAEWSGGAPADCTTTYTLPALDGLVAVVALGLTASLLLDDAHADDDDSRPNFGARVAPVAILPGLLYGASAAHGAHTKWRCDAYRAHLRAPRPSACPSDRDQRCLPPTARPPARPNPPPRPPPARRPPPWVSDPTRSTSP